MPKPIVFTNGCFDILHKGHVELLRYCENLGDLYVGINSDTSVKKLKGTNRPIHNQRDRKYMIENLFKVKEVIIFNELTPIKLIKKIKPDLIVKGGDYEENNVVGNLEAKIIIFPYIKGYSSSKIIRKIQKNKIW